MTGPAPSPMVLGILGGGQLGRMTALAAARLGIPCHIYAPETNAPAFQVCDRSTIAAYDDTAALSAFAEQVTHAAVEFENIPFAALTHLQACGLSVVPGRTVLEIAQDRSLEKAFFNEIGLKTAPWAAVSDAESLEAALSRIGPAAILKTSRMGYDGKGQLWLTDADAASGPEALWHRFREDTQAEHAVLEGRVAFAYELSVIVARTAEGEAACFDPADNEHRDGILRRSRVPGRIPGAVTDQAQQIALQTADALNLVGMLAIELFATDDGTLLVNEMAPRPHNSGHWTMDGCQTDQFEQFVRAVCGLPLGSTTRHRDMEMENLIGDDMDRLPALLREPGAHLHLYGKETVRPGRKMGHVNRALADPSDQA